MFLRNLNNFNYYYFNCTWKHRAVKITDTNLATLNIYEQFWPQLKFVGCF